MSAFPFNYSVIISQSKSYFSMIRSFYWLWTCMVMHCWCWSCFGVLPTFGRSMLPALGLKWTEWGGDCTYRCSLIPMGCWGGVWCNRTGALGILKKLTFLWPIVSVFVLSYMVFGPHVIEGCWSWWGTTKPCCLKGYVLFKILQMVKLQCKT